MDSHSSIEIERTTGPIQSAENRIEDTEPHIEEPPAFQHSWSVLSIFLVLCLFSFLSALDGTIITTSLPTITRDIEGGKQLYLWVAQSFLFASTVPQPLYGQIANIFGRRNPFLVAIVLFALGSGISGGASSPSMLIAGRTVQGLGSAGLCVLSDIIICDVVPPRNRGGYLSAVLTSAAIGSTMGPVVGGALAEANWRWIFYLNVPISFFGLIIMIFLLNVSYTRSPTWLHALKRVDFIGALIFIPSTISLFLGLITGGVQHPWSSWRVILPLVLGVVGSASYHLYEATPSLCPSPSTPPRLFQNRTSATGFLLVFLSSIMVQAIAYFLPLYFQGVKLVSPLLSGVYYLPFALAIMPFAGFGGWALSRYGRYIPLHYCGFGLLAIGAGLFSTLSAESSRGAWIGFQIIASAGIALIFTSTMPSTLAPLKEEDVAVATATYSFVRSLGDGGAYAFAAEGNGVRGLGDEETKGQVIEVYIRALRVVWLVMVAVALLGFVSVPVERHIELGKSHETEFGLERSAKGKTSGLKRGDRNEGEIASADEKRTALETITA
ncbi:MFS efflux transporter [Lachnellula subtilissima]|uniref:MFS efflux transporter n=1 Tax=Lachnellula subtilissima TaxID=602034 RepID=A0A8H8RMY9_9HELO|nr:MFS efflux transporter [Lachnellula subtilissima]